jgi:hypothetical protein
MRRIVEVRKLGYKPEVRDIVLGDESRLVEIEISVDGSQR